MGDNDAGRVFDAIAPVYGLFYPFQRMHFERVLRRAKSRCDVSQFQSALDVGCGPGALCTVLNGMGLKVTGLDVSPKMIDIARAKPGNRGVSLLTASALDGLPFPDKSFDVSFACFVAHGMQPEERLRLYREMARVTRHKVIIHDFNKKRGLLTTILEKMEGGDYFRFIHVAEDEMRACGAGEGKCFDNVEVFPVATRVSWYVCTPE